MRSYGKIEVTYFCMSCGRFTDFFFLKRWRVPGDQTGKCELSELIYDEQYGPWRTITALSALNFFLTSHFIQLFLLPGQSRIAHLVSIVSATIGFASQSIL